ncbi:hypothetical protein CesoFtcFv8_025398 [Champsocephalus esox]|uniref:Uncharacterized protein n=1 Tax=Champsocephalus esox TaxID=159716 RepID=A0AAN8GEZ7_9TELE|nr:hypothetical protein CesoFtcFv8_025398 [Champsocephalus esox]
MMDNQGGDRESASGSSVSARGEEPSSGELPPELTCPPEDYRTAKFSLAAYLLCWALLRWYQKLRCQSAPPQPQEALEHSPHPSEGLGLEEGDLGADSQEWCNRGTGGGHTSDEYCDSRSRHSDTLSDLSPDGEDSVDALLGLEGACLSRRATVSTFRVGQRKARRREVVTAKEERRDAQTETYVGRFRCSRRKSPENHVEPNIPTELRPSDLCHPGVPKTSAYDAVSYTSASSTCDEFEDPVCPLDRNTNHDKMTKRSKSKGSQAGSKSSKFSVFAKMPSFRKSKGSKGAPGEEITPESSDCGGEGLLSEQGPHRENSDDEVFVKGNVLNQSLSSMHYEMEEEDSGFFPSSPKTRHVRQGSNGEGNGGPSPDNPLLSLAQAPNGQTYKRSKSNDSLNIRMRFAQAHKSLSSLFESRSLDKENEEQATVGADVDSGLAKQTSRRLKKAREAELLKRAISVPEGECTSSASGPSCEDTTSSPLLDRLSSPGSPTSPGARHHTDPTSKREVPWEASGNETPHGCKSEGQRRKLSPNGELTTESGLPLFLDDSAVSQPINTSPVSPLSSSLATLTQQISPAWTKSHPGVSESLTKGPLRPMSPKPNSPRPTAQRKIFCYSHSARASSACPFLLSQSVSVEGLTDPPERPKTLKPSASPVGVSLSPVDAAEGRIDSQSQISSIGSINELEGTPNSGRPRSLSRTRRLLEVKSEVKSEETSEGTPSVVPNDHWIEEQKRNNRKLARAIRGSLGQLHTLLSEDMDKTDAGVSLGPIEAFRGMPLKSHCFSQSTPIGLDCLGWRRHISYFCKYPSD